MDAKLKFALIALATISLSVILGIALISAVPMLLDRYRLHMDNQVSFAYTRERATEVGYDTAGITNGILEGKIFAHGHG